MADYQHIVGEAYERLADFIILQAAEDYQEALKKLRKHPGNTSAAYEARKIENFFRSDWYHQLTDVDGDYMIKRLKGETA